MRLQIKKGWPQADILTLITLYNEERTLSEISKVIDKPINAVKYKIQLLRKDGTLTMLYKTCYVCRSKMPVTERFNKCSQCYQKTKENLTGKLLLDLENS